MKVVAVACLVIVAAPACILFGADVPCVSAANCLVDEVCDADGFCTTDSGEQAVGRCGDASRAVVDASLDADDDSLRRYRTIRGAVDALAAAQVSAPCIDVLGGTYRENGAITLSPGTTLKGDNPFQQGTQQTIIFGGANDAPRGFLVVDATLEGLRIEGNGTVVAPASADADIVFSLTGSTIANGAAVVLQTAQQLRVQIADSAFSLSTLSIDGPTSDTVLSTTSFVRSRLEVTFGAAVTIDGGTFVTDDKGALLSTESTRLSDVTFTPFSTTSTDPCTPALTIGGGSATLSDVQIGDMPCAAILIRDEVAALGTVVLGTDNNARVDFNDNLVDVVVEIVREAESGGAVITADDVDWSREPECGDAVCTCSTVVAITTGDGACTSACVEDVCGT